MTNNDKQWLAGLLEGEGYFVVLTVKGYRYPRLGVNMNDEDVIARVARIIGKPYHKKGEKQWQVRMQGEQAVNLMREILPLMGARRAKKIEELLAEFVYEDGKLLGRGPIFGRPPEAE
jgi:hypothetical protein